MKKDRVVLAPAFTMIELIFVIVVMGIVAMIASDIIANMYNRYLLSRTYNRLEIKTEQALDVISRRLEYRIKPSVIAKEFNNSMIPLSAVAGHAYPILEWLGYDNDGLDGNYDSTAGMVVPGWDGFVDLNASSTSQITTPGSYLQSVAKPILDALSQDINTSAEKPAIVFFNANMNNPYRYGWNGGDFNNTIPVTFTGETTMNLNNTPDSIHEKYYLAWSAYAIVPLQTDGSNCTNPSTQDCNLYFYYDFRPWEGDEYQNGTRALITEHITQFTFKQIGGAIHVKLCAADVSFNKYAEQNASICKERVIF